jgi:hypothetical protein
MMVTLKSRLDCNNNNNFTLLLSLLHCAPRLDAFAGNALAECAVLTVLVRCMSVRNVLMQVSSFS